ncbi:hypothetical protein IM660_11985 [Ruania alkalisoli]|uniref:Uncharacterized protein n=1 Tax=Ruania alkalisoli TaxID=2779775 RepID=A0A7M1SPL5_9MICO|nr:hypothetical protein [Ruania alkalisoli]QOR69415.1 hypothetical protein IM660_11985 [Ruania alkalisoli]
MNSRPATALLATATLLFLAGCTGDPTDGVPEPSASASPGESSPVATTDAPEPSGSEEPAASGIVECEPFVLAEGGQVPGAVVGDCVAAAMVAAGTGVQRVDSSDGTSSVVQFRWDPDYAMSIDGDQQVVIEGDTGWVQVPGSGWIQADPGSSDPQVVMATSIVQLVRAFSDPRMLAEGFGQAESWTIVEETDVPVEDAVADTAWLLQPEGGILPLGDITVTDVELWLRSDYLGVYTVGTGSYAGVSVTTSNTFLEWGEPVEIPDPSQD